MTALVSILVPAYNKEKWIADTIKSALNQTWPAKEIIIVDDGSSDNTLQIAKGFGSKSVKVIGQENRGASAARNKALSFAQGDFIQWLDADDLLAPDKISRQLKESDNNKETRILLSSGFGKFYYRLEKARFISNSLCQDLAPKEWLLIKFNEGDSLISESWLVSRRLTELAGPWNERLSFDDDGEYFCRVVSVSEKVKFVLEAITYYRVGNLGSLSNNRSDRALESLFTSISLCINRLRSLEDSERTRKAGLRYLQNWVFYFYPEKHEILDRVRSLAKDLGGDLLPPDVGWKFYVTKTILGWKLAKKVKDAAWNGELYARRNWDRLFFI